MKSIILIFIMAIGITGCQPATSGSNNSSNKGKIKVSVFYAAAEGNTFDMDYYRTKHFPLVKKLLGDALISWSIDKGMAGGSPEAPLPYLAVGHLYFDSVEAFQNAFGPHAEEIRNDIPNYTNVQPVVLISEVIE